MERYGTIQGILRECFGLRNWLKYDEPFCFNIAVNDMAEVIKHDDAPLPHAYRYSIQSSCGGGNYRVATTGKSKRL